MSDGLVNEPTEFWEEQRYAHGSKLLWFTMSIKTFIQKFKIQKKKKCEQYIETIKLFVTINKF